MRKPLSQLMKAIQGPFLRFAKIFIVILLMFFTAHPAIGQNQSAWSLDQVESVTGNGNPTTVPTLTPSQNFEEALLFLFTMGGTWSCVGPLVGPLPCYDPGDILHSDYLTSLSAPWQTEPDTYPSYMPAGVVQGPSNMFFRDNGFIYDYWDNYSTPVGVIATVNYDNTIIGDNWAAILALVKYQGSISINRPIVAGTFNGIINGTTGMGNSNPGFLTFSNDNPGFLIGMVSISMNAGSIGAQNITGPAGDSCQIIAVVMCPTGCSENSVMTAPPAILFRLWSAFPDVYLSKIH